MEGKNSSDAENAKIKGAMAQFQKTEVGAERMLGLTGAAAVSVLIAGIRDGLENPKSRQRKGEQEIAHMMQRCVKPRLVALREKLPTLLVYSDVF